VPSDVERGRLNAPDDGFVVVRQEITNEGEHELVVSFPTQIGGRSELKISRGLLTDTKRARSKFVSHGAVASQDWPSLLERLLAESPQRVVRQTKVAGWHDDTFLSVFGAFTKNHVSPSVALSTGKLAVEPAEVLGSLAEYRAGVLPFLKSDFVLLGLLLGITPVIASRIGRRGGFTVCLSQESSSGKTLCIQTAQSIVHKVEEADLTAKLGSTSGVLLDTLPTLGGSCLCFQDIKGDIDAHSMKKLRALVFNIASSSVRQRLTDEALPSPQYAIAFLSAERPLSTLFAESKLQLETGDIVRLLEIEVPHGSVGGIFEGYSDAPSADWARRLETFLRQQHGTLLPRLVHRLVFADTSRLSRTMEEFEQEFLDPLRGLPTYQQRAAKNFAVVAAAGRVAVRARLLPVNECFIIEGVTRLFWRWANARSRTDEDLQAKWRRVFAILDDPAEVPTVERGAAPPIASFGFRRSDRGVDYVFVGRSRLSEIFTGPDLDGAIAQLEHLGCLSRQNSADRTVPVRTAGNADRNRFYRLIAARLLAAQAHILRPP